MRIGHLPAIKEEPWALVEAAHSLLSPAATPWVGVIPPEAMVLEPWQSSESDSCRHVRSAHSNTEPPVLPWLWTTKLTPLPVVSSAAAVRAGASNREVREIVEAESEREEQLAERAEWREWARLHPGRYRVPPQEEEEQENTTSSPPTTNSLQCEKHSLGGVAPGGESRSVTTLIDSTSPPVHAQVGEREHKVSMVPVSGPEAVTKGSTSLAWAHDQWHGPTTQEGKRIPVTPGGASDEVVMAQGVGSGSGEAGLASWVLPESVFQEMHYGPQGPFLGLHAEPHHPRWLQRFGETPAGLEALAVGSHCVVIPLCKLGSVSVERWLEDAHLGNRVSCTLVCPAVLEPTEEAALKEGGFRLEKEWSEEQLGALGWGVQGWYREGDTTHWPSLATKTQEELMPPPKGEISPEEKAKREALKWVEVPTNKAAFVARGDQFSDEVQAWVQGVSIPCMGDPELVEVVQQYSQQYPVKEKADR